MHLEYIEEGTEGELINDVVLIEEANESDMNASEDEDVFYDSDFNLSDDDMFFDDYVDHNVEFGGSNKGKSVEGSEWCSDDMYTIVPTENIKEEWCVHSDDDFDRIYGSDDEGKMKYRMDNLRAKNKNPDLILGLIFSSKEEAKFVIQSRCLRRNYNNSSLKSGWIGKAVVKKFKNNPKLGTSEFRNELCTTLKANVSKWQACWAKSKAMNLMHGKMEEQFNKIWDYCEEIMRSNPRSNVRIKLIGEEGERKWFHRFYMCFNACKMGFINDCRLVVGVDGCFLKAKHGGQLLSAVALDANNNIYPIAYAAIESEKDSWMWFLRLLDRDLGFENNHNWIFMSDKQKGPISAFEALFSNAENQFCVRYLHSNMKKDGFIGLALKQAMWAAIRACRVDEFERKMEVIRKKTR
ncbi:UNVERIFIED_CONTAM: hypothetical protein Slati_1506800 [Sesamum latifolium]|uniref:MULE transposase domain-containing protein n=1 Tax=Sesamum latifolium TaxID=2727402 RepID=A0AAW2X8E1_9LAMI